MWGKLVLLGGLTLAGCAAPAPVEEYNIARTAIQAAQAEGAPRMAAAFWIKAEDHYRKGQKYYSESDFGRAREQFDLARQYAERAENATRLRKLQSGDF